MDQNVSVVGQTCKCVHHKAVPALVFLFGLLFFLGTLGWVSVATVNLGWPILFMLGGLAKMFGPHCKCCSGHN